MDESLQELFESHFGEPATEVVALKADGSNRKLFRLKSSKNTAICVVNPDAKENKAFLEFSRQFRDLGLPVPEIYSQDLKAGAYLQEDLGDTTLFQALSENRSGHKIEENIHCFYKMAAMWLPQFQIKANKGLDYSFSYPRGRFDKQSMLWDLNLFKYYFLRLANIHFDEDTLERDFEELSLFLLEAPGNFFLYRDFQSRNIMIKEGKLYFIDYQGGRKGALQYDIASLLFDAKADLPLDLRQGLLEDYLIEASKLAPINKYAFMKYYDGYVLIRILQALGAYGLRGFYERKSHFLQSIPYAIGNLEFLLRKARFLSKLPELRNVLKRLVVSSYLRQFGRASLKLTVRIQSFSYKQGIPQDETIHGGGHVFDCRALPNPGKFKEYEKLTGQDPEVMAFLDKEAFVGEFMNHVYALVDQSVKNYKSRNFTDLMVSFGCTGGLHRSIYCAELLAKHLKEKYAIDTELCHRSLEVVGVTG